ncbi:hypothetical protein D3C80_1197720 [compost metagenome]
MPGLALNQVAQHIIGDPATQAAQDVARVPDRLVEHQRHLIVKTRRRWADLQGHRVAVGPVKKWRFQALGQRRELLALRTATLWPGGYPDVARAVNHTQFRKIFGLCQLVE